MAFGAQTCLAEGVSISCGLPESFESNSDVAGVGILVSFVVAAALCLGTSFVMLYLEYPSNKGAKKTRSTTSRWRTFFDSTLVGLSDTQLVTTLGLLVTTHYFVDCTISVYHYDLVCSLVLVSIATHIGPVAVMHRYYDSHWSLGLLRACLIIPSFVLAGLVFDRQRTSKIFPVYVPHSNVEGNSTGLVLPAACFQGHPSIHKTGNYKDFTSSDFWTTNQTTPSNINNASAAIASRQLSASNSTILNDTMSVYSNFASDDNITDRWNIVVLACLIFAVIFAAAISFGQKMGDHSARTHRIAVGGKSLSVFICFAAALFGLVRFVKLRSWMQDSQWLRHDDGETDYKSFGQLLPMIMLALPFLAAFEQWVANEAPNTKAREYGDGQEMDPLTYNRT